MDQLSTVILALLTVATPMAVQWVKTESWTKTAKVGIPALASTILALAYLLITQSITTGMEIIPTILVVYGGQQLVYTTIMRWWDTILEQRGQPADDDGPDHRA